MSIFTVLYLGSFLAMWRRSGIIFYKLPFMALPDIRPMLPTLTDKPFDSGDWLFEIKHDGFRIVAYIEKGNVRLKTRKNVDYTTEFKFITDQLAKWKAKAIIDGEIVVLTEEGISDFNALQNYKPGDAVYYYVFDLLHYNGKDFTREPLHKRKAQLKKVLPKLPGIRYNDHIVGKGKAMFELAEQAGAEGLIAKRLNSLYRQGVKTKDWLKIKVMKEGVFRIAGFAYSVSGLKSLILCDDALNYAGDVGTGFNAKEVGDILGRIKPVKKCPLTTEPVFRGRWGAKAPAHIAWCRPSIRCLVKYLEKTEAGELRHASFKNLI